LQGVVRLARRLGDFVLIVTFGRGQGEHTFDEGISTEGILRWQSQPRQGTRFIELGIKERAAWVLVPIDAVLEKLPIVACLPRSCEIRLSRFHSKSRSQLRGRRRAQS
jgi:hypothetical protein